VVIFSEILSRWTRSFSMVVLASLISCWAL